MNCLCRKHAVNPECPIHGEATGVRSPLLKEPGVIRGSSAVRPGAIRKDALSPGSLSSDETGYPSSDPKHREGK